ncbi:MAG: proton-conducting transporter membrane subunit [Methanofollis sp.]|uniref:NADH-quinone oxidoreductase subunit 5 family protein n=1 Tax=Methanofollis sp. TaxID=2052835 RepID=UPI00260B7F7D|nr:proton-conducting transporter membrane subunit [Methanofollis sp.]MDD4255827.1 proton-conducting transporter membrane subunit [Methanofollis sp.]
MYDLIFLILFPCIIAAILLLLNNNRVRHAIVALGALVISAGSIYLLVSSFTQGAVYYTFPFEPTSLVMFALEMGIALLLLYLGVRFKQPIAVLLVLIQSAMMIYYEITWGMVVEPEMNLFIDQFSIIMALIIGIIGSLIAVFATSYMDTYHGHHPEVRDRRRMFFFVIFIFLAAMFGLVFSNNIPWIFFFWEITTLSSFLLIGYSETEEATNNAFLALKLNLLGGIAFAGAILYLASVDPSGGLLELNALLASGQAVAIIPAVLISFAGLTKSAQMPFSGWLVGAMVAPTPVSALLHSSTMVKAGVYIIVRFAPVLAGSLAGLSIAFVGAVTFLLASGIAISQSNAKKVLAYSTIANLGLIVACAGVGTPQLVWAAIFLIIFHAVAKSLLFLCVGTVEHRTGSRDIEDMDGLIVRLPKVAAMMFIGMAGMFLAPFGMLISKWAAIEAFIVAPLGLIFVMILAFGGAVTVFFWAKWMGKIIEVTPFGENLEGTVSTGKWVVLGSLTAMTVLAALLFPLISSFLVEPYVLGIFNETARLAQDNVIIMVLMIALLLVLPLSYLSYRKQGRTMPAYMGGRPTTPDMKFLGSLGIEREMTMRNYYFTDLFGEAKLLKVGNPLCILLILAAIAVIAGVAL